MMRIFLLAALCLPLSFSAHSGKKSEKKIKEKKERWSVLTSDRLGEHTNEACSAFTSGLSQSRIAQPIELQVVEFRTNVPFSSLPEVDTPENRALFRVGSQTYQRQFESVDFLRAFEVFGGPPPGIPSKESKRVAFVETWSRSQHQLKSGKLHSLLKASKPKMRTRMMYLLWPLIEKERESGLWSKVRFLQGEIRERAIFEYLNRIWNERPKLWQITVRQVLAYLFLDQRDPDHFALQMRMGGQVDLEKPTPSDGTQVGDGNPVDLLFRKVVQYALTKEKSVKEGLQEDTSFRSVSSMVIGVGYSDDTKEYELEYETYLESVVFQLAIPRPPLNEFNLHSHFESPVLAHLIERATDRDDGQFYSAERDFLNSLGEYWREISSGNCDNCKALRSYLLIEADLPEDARHLYGITEAEQTLLDDEVWKKSYELLKETPVGNAIQTGGDTIVDFIRMIISKGRIDAQ